MLHPTMRDGTITAILAIVGFTAPLAFAWHQGCFDSYDDPPVVNAVVVPAHPAAVRMATTAVVVNPVAAATDTQISVASSDAPAENDSERLAPPDDGTSADPIAAEARETIRANRQH